MHASFQSRGPGDLSLERWKLECEGRIPLSLRGLPGEPLEEEWVGFIPFAPVEGTRGAWGLGELFLIENGTADSVSFHPVELFRPLLVLRAPGFFLLHFHPSGSLVPSAADLLLTRRGHEVARSLGMTFGGHAIVTESRIAWIPFGPRARRQIREREGESRTGRMIANARPKPRHEFRDEADRSHPHLLLRRRGDASPSL